MTTPHWVDEIALAAANEISRIPPDWPEPRKKAATQNIVIDAIKSVRGAYCQDTLTRVWQELVEKDDRTSPEDHPDMALITRDELADFLSR